MTKFIVCVSRAEILDLLTKHLEYTKKRKHTDNV